MKLKINKETIENILSMSDVLEMEETILTDIYSKLLSSRLDHTNYMLLVKIFVEMADNLVEHKTKADSANILSNLFKFDEQDDEDDED